MPRPLAPKKEDIERIRKLASIRRDALLGNPVNAVRWYRDKIREAGFNRTPPQAMFQSDFGLIDRDVGAGMYLFNYDPKLKAKLPYYDTFPLVIPFRFDFLSFHGLNLHYIHPAVRFVVLNKLIDLQNKKKVNWDTLKQFSMFPEIQPCVKQYLYTHLGSSFLKINRPDWETVVMMPLERFEKRSKNTVFQESASR